MYACMCVCICMYVCIYIYILIIISYNRGVLGSGRERCCAFHTTIRDCGVCRYVGEL